MYFFTMEMTRRRFASTIFVRAVCPALRTRLSSENVVMNSSAGMPNCASRRDIFSRTCARSLSRFFDGRACMSADCFATSARYGR